MNFCIICGKPLSSLNTQDTCSGECWKIAVKKEIEMINNKYIEIIALADNVKR